MEKMGLLVAPRPVSIVQFCKALVTVPLQGQGAPLDSPISPSLIPRSFMMPQAPKAQKILHVHQDPHGTREDHYHWLKNRDNPEVIKYLEAENSYLESFMKDTESLQELLFDEIRGRIKETDESVPYQKGPYEYLSTIEQGQEYHAHVRRSPNGEDQTLLLDENELASGREYFTLGVFEVSPNHELLAWSEDDNGSERYVIKVKDLRSGEILKDELHGTSTSLAWLKDNSGFLYVKLNEKDQPDQVYLHTLGDDPENDKLLYKEGDGQYFVSCWLSKDEDILFIGSFGKITNEVLWSPADSRDKLNFKSLWGRREGVEYHPHHHSGHFITLTNHDEPNFRIITLTSEGKETKEWARGSSKTYYESLDVFEDFFVTAYREKGLPQISWIDFKTEVHHKLDLKEKTYHSWLGHNPEQKTTKFRFGFSSPRSPRRVEEFDTTTHAITTLKVQEIPSGYNAADYETDFLQIPSHDGVEVPVSLFYRKDTPLDGTSPAYLKAYGSYGSSYPAHFSAASLSLVDRGFVYAIAHIRGGSELGRRWYEGGKFENKKNTFEDFIHVAKGLIERKLSHPKKLAVQGGSAGGLLVGAALNQEPELFGAVVAHVPFVDALSTMLDDSLPLTQLEYAEWGNPNELKYYEYIGSYSPYDNLKPNKFPPILITSGLNDRRVTYWEPAKWCAKLRELNTGNNPILMKTHMGAGHGGASGRYESLKEMALEYAFLLKVFKLGK